MAHALRVFAGPLTALRPFTSIWAAARIYALTPGAHNAVLPYDEPLQEAVHRRFGTGDWPEHQQVLLSTTDQSFAAECSLLGPIAYIETAYFEGSGRQSAAVWQSGQLTLGPVTLEESDRATGRVQSLRPINLALRSLRVSIVDGAVDEFDSFGLGRYRSNSEIHANATPLTI